MNLPDLPQRILWLKQMEEVAKRVKTYQKLSGKIFEDYTKTCLANPLDPKLEEIRLEAETHTNSCLDAVHELCVLNRKIRGLK